MLEFLRDYFFYIWNFFFRRNQPISVAPVSSEADGSCEQSTSDKNIRFESTDTDTTLEAPEPKGFSKEKSVQSSSTDTPTEPKSGTPPPQFQTSEDNVPKYDPKQNLELRNREPRLQPNLESSQIEIASNPEKEAFEVDVDEIDDIDKEILDYEEELLHKEIEEENLRRKFCTNLDKDSFDSEEELLHKEIDEENSRRKACKEQPVSDNEKELKRKEFDEEDLHRKVREHLKALQEQENHVFQPPQSKIPQHVSRLTSDKTHLDQPSAQSTKSPEPISHPNITSQESKERALFSKSEIENKPVLKHSPRATESTEYESDEEVTESDDEIELENKNEQTHKFLNDLTK